jgi:hypothetical protein
MEEECKPADGKQICRIKDKVMLRDEQGKLLASIKVFHEDEHSIGLADWKARLKGHGYGRELVKELTKNKPDLVIVTTDGFTEKGAANIIKILPDFKITAWHHGWNYGLGTLMRQDYIDHLIDRQKESEAHGVKRRPLMPLDPSLHS